MADIEKTVETTETEEVTVHPDSTPKVPTRTDVEVEVQVETTETEVVEEPEDTE